MKNKTRANAINILLENYEQVEQQTLFYEYVILESEGDPYFFSWLFCYDEDIDTKSDLNKDQLKEFDLFINECKEI